MSRMSESTQLERRPWNPSRPRYLHAPTFKSRPCTGGLCAFIHSRSSAADRCCYSQLALFSFVYSITRRYQEAFISFFFFSFWVVGMVTEAKRKVEEPSVEQPAGWSSTGSSHAYIFVRFLFSERNDRKPAAPQAIFDFCSQTLF